MEQIKAKINQAVEILRELDIDLWLTLCRESESTPDPVTDLIAVKNVCWLSGFFISGTGATTVLLGEADAADYDGAGLYDNVFVYGEDVGEEVRRIVRDLDPARIALNYSPSNVTADGLSHGLFLQLAEWLEGTPYADRLVSAEDIIAKLRGRKNPFELERLEIAARTAAQCWDEALTRIRTGMTEMEIAAVIEEGMQTRGLAPSFQTIVNAGSKTASGHGSPTTAVLEKGDLLHVDFGVRYEGYCSDIQRVAYFRKDGEENPPPELAAAFDKIKSIVDETGKMYAPGVPGHEIDRRARKMLLDDGYPEYKHALGHQIGLSVHDGAAVVGPRWKRYGRQVEIPLEEGNVFTVELGITLEGIGHVSLEEDLVVTPGGGRFISPRQTELTLR